VRRERRAVPLRVGVATSGAFAVAITSCERDVTAAADVGSADTAITVAAYALAYPAFTSGVATNAAVADTKCVADRAGRLVLASPCEWLSVQ